MNNDIKKAIDTLDLFSVLNDSNEPTWTEVLIRKMEKSNKPLQVRVEYGFDDGTRFEIFVNDTIAAVFYAEKRGDAIILRRVTMDRDFLDNKQKWLLNLNVKEQFIMLVVYKSVFHLAQLNNCHLILRQGDESVIMKLLEIAMWCEEHMKSSKILNLANTKISLSFPCDSPWIFHIMSDNSDKDKPTNRNVKVSVQDIYALDFIYNKAEHPLIVEMESECSWMTPAIKRCLGKIMKIFYEKPVKIYNNGKEFKDDFIDYFIWIEPDNYEVAVQALKRYITWRREQANMKSYQYSVDELVTILIGIEALYEMTKELLTIG